MQHLCKKCGKVIVQGRNGKGAEINFDAGRAVYLKIGSDENGIIAELEPDAYVDHDQICENRNLGFGENGGIR